MLKKNENKKYQFASNFNVCKTKTNDWMTQSIHQCCYGHYVTMKWCLDWKYKILLFYSFITTTLYNKNRYQHKEATYSTCVKIPKDTKKKIILQIKDYLRESLHLYKFRVVK